MRPDALRVDGLRRRVSRQPLRRAVQPAEGHAARARRRTARRSRPTTPTSSSPTTATSTRPTCSRTPTAACSWSTPAAGTSSAARRRSSPSPTCSAAIYRVRRTDAPSVDDPRGLKLAWKTMTPVGSPTTASSDDRPAVQDRAVRELGGRTSGAIPALDRCAAVTDVRRMRGETPSGRSTRIDGAAGARGRSNRDRTIADDSVRHAAIHAAGLWRDRGGGRRPCERR